MFVYKITNKLNGKAYIGQTIQDPKDRWYRHCSKHPFTSALFSAIKKYGREHFEMVVVDTAESIDDLSKKEIFWIEKLDTYNTGYNMDRGGKGGKLEESTKAKISNSLKGKKKPHFWKPVICLNTGEVFESQTAACKRFGISKHTISKQIARGGSTRDGLRFKMKEVV